MTTTVSEMVDRITTYYEQADERTREAGAGWYPVAAELAEEIGTLACVDPLADPTVIGAGILAALSPRIQWSYNITAARAVAIRPYLRPSGIFTSSWLKAQRICNGDAPSKVLGGRKVTSFYRNILGDDSVVCVDGHAYRLAVGPGCKGKHLERKGEYDRVEASYILAARQAGVSPTTMQACTWLVRQQEQRAEASAQRVAARYGKR